MASFRAIGCVHILGIEPTYLWANMLRYTEDVIW